MWPRVRYADADGVSIAYEVVGDGPIDVVLVDGLIGGLVADSLDPRLVASRDRLAAFSRVIHFDRRGQGLSDPVAAGPMPLLEQQAADIVAVMDHAGSRRAALRGSGDGVQVAILFAALYPDRVRALVLMNAWARAYQANDYPLGARPVDRELLAQQVRDRWGNVDNPLALRRWARNRLDEPGFRELFARVQQASASKAAAVAGAVNRLDRDVRDVLPLVQAPTLVHVAADRRGDELEQAEFLATRIPNARIVTYNGVQSLTPDYTAEDWACVEEFLTGTRPTTVSDRLLATVLFTDIVASTERLAEIGDRNWRAELDRHDAVVREQLARFGGREISTAGDSFFATFTGPAQAIYCAQNIIDHAAAVGIAIRAGVHTGECEVRGSDLGGIAVHIGARVAALADTGHVLTTSTVKDLVAGSSIAFSDYGVHQLKGIPDPWHLYTVAP